MPDHHDHQDIPNTDEKDTPYPGTYLFIKDNPADNGSEPLPPGMPFWISPDITIIKPDGSRGAEALAGQQNIVEVFVNNNGDMEALDADVDVFHADPSTAFTPATATRIGIGPLTIPPTSRKEITFPWTPLASESGHRCLLARVSLFIPFDSYLNGSIFDVPGDRHVSQRNLHVVPVGDADETEFRFKIVNPLRASAAFAVHATEIRDERQLDLLRMSTGCGALRIGAEPLQSLTISAGNRLVDAAPLDLRRIRNIRRRDIAAPFIRERLSSQGLSVKVREDEAVDAGLTVRRNPATAQGEAHAIQITQFGDDGTVHGGLTVLLQY